MPPKKLYGVADFADIAGISRQRAHIVMLKPEFPVAYAVTRTGYYWELHQFQEFLALWDRTAGRPKRT